MKIKKVKKVKTMPKYATYGQLVDEIGKFDPNGRAAIIASTDIDNPDIGENFVDGAGVKRVGVGNGVVTIACGDSGRMTWGQVRAAMLDGITLGMADRPAVVQIGYDGMKDANGGPCAPRRAENCAVAEGDEIWNVKLGPEA